MPCYFPFDWHRKRLQFSLYLGAGEQKKAEAVVGNGIAMMLTFGIVYAILIEIFLQPLLLAFGATSENLPYALTYSRIIALGMPFQVVTTSMSNMIRADGSPKYSMTCMLIGAIANTILDPIFIFVFDLGVAGAAWQRSSASFFLSWPPFLISGDSRVFSCIGKISALIFG